MSLRRPSEVAPRVAGQASSEAVALECLTAVEKLGLTTESMESDRSVFCVFSAFCGQPELLNSNSTVSYGPTCAGNRSVSTSLVAAIPAKAVLCTAL